MGISSAIDGYFITACSAEGDTEDESLRRGTCNRGFATNMGTGPLFSSGIELGPYQGHALMRPGPSNAQGNLLALQWHPTAGYSLNFVADLIQSLVIGQENIPRIVMSSDVLKKEMLHLGRIEWTLETK